jgi:hypothetical protein
MGLRGDWRRLDSCDRCKTTRIGSRAFRVWRTIQRLHLPDPTRIANCRAHVRDILEEVDVSLRTPSEQSAFVSRLFVAVLLLLGLIVSCLVVRRLDPGRANFNGGPRMGDRPHVPAETGRQ